MDFRVQSHSVFRTFTRFDFSGNYTTFISDFCKGAQHGSTIDCHAFDLDGVFVTCDDSTSLVHYSCCIFRYADRKCLSFGVVFCRGDELSFLWVLQYFILFVFIWKNRVVEDVKIKLFSS